MPAPDSFVDTNLLLYAISTEPSEAAKAAVAQQLLASANWCWSAQVAAEFVNASTSQRRPVPLSLNEAEQWINLWSAFPMAAIDLSIVKEAVRLAQRYRVSYFDAQILAAAKGQTCKTLYSEDFNDGQDYDGVVVTNPFARLNP